MHKRHAKLMQIGGHIEITETPWQTLAHELKAESGYELKQLNVLQPTVGFPVITTAVVHPIPLLVNTHRIGESHFHTDLCYAFVTSQLPKQAPAADESQDLRWPTLDEYRLEVESGTALRDVLEIYEFALQVRDSYMAMPAASFSLEHPATSTV
jgi:hypothetical protein